MAIVQQEIERADGAPGAPSATADEGEKRLTRWAKPYGEMTEMDLLDVLQMDPFRSICDTLEAAKKPQFVSFGVPVSIYGILMNDARIRTYDAGDFVIRKDDYGNSAFFILEGELRAVIQPELPARLLGHRERRSIGFVGSFLSRLRDMLLPRATEYRAAKTKTRKDEEKGTGVSAQHLADILDPNKYQTAPMKPGAFFGEIGAIYRMPREISIVAATSARVLELRWQGLRDLMEADEGIEHHIDEMYRKRSLKGRLSPSPSSSPCPRMCCPR